MEHDAAVIAIKALLGGTMVTAFAVVGHLLRPKWFAGLFAAAPSVAVASLAVTVVDKGHHDAALAAYAMVFGAAGFVAFSVVRPSARSPRPMPWPPARSAASSGSWSRWAPTS